MTSHRQWAIISETLLIDAELQWVSMYLDMGVKLVGKQEVGDNIGNNFETLMNGFL
jgi:hypothetical protein